MLFDKKEINIVCFTDGKFLLLNDLHGNYLLCKVEWTFHLYKNVETYTYT